MASSMKVQSYMHNKVLPCIRKKFPDTCMKTEPGYRGTNLMKVSLYCKIPEICGDMEIPFFSYGRQPVIDEMAKVLTRKTGMDIKPIASGFLIPCD